MFPENGFSVTDVVRLDFSETVTVVVGDGDSKQQFLLHKNIISRQSKFFRAAFSGNFVEAKKKIVELPEADPIIFKIWAQWAYSGNVVLLSASEQEVPIVRCNILRMRCGELYVLADILEDTWCRNFITGLLRKEFFQWGPTVELYKIAYESTPENSKLRMLCRDWKLANPVGIQLSKSRDELPAALYRDLAIEWARADLDKAKFVEPKDAAKCKYHDHNEEVPACEEEPKTSPEDKKTS